jgi:hypothetical protein
MLARRLLLFISLPVVLSFAIPTQQTRSNSLNGTAAEMKKLAEALVGDWNNVETMEPSERFPHGAQRKGTSHCGLTTGGTTLICQGSSDGSAGKLDHLIVIWWDKDAKNYGFFICFKDWGSGCEIRGTVHWEGNEFVNDYTEEVKGKPTNMRDTFTDIGPNSHTLIAAIETAEGKMKTLITTRSTRR